MKKIILFVLIFFLLSIVVIAIELSNKKININNIKSSKLTKEEKQKLENYYFDKEKGMKEIKEYKKVGNHVVIYFNDTSYRVFTSKKHFKEVIK